MAEPTATGTSRVDRALARFVAVLGRLRWPVVGLWLVLLAVAITGTLVAAVLGGKAGEGFHRRVDRAAVKAL